MTIGTISYWFYDAITSMKKNKKNIFISIGTMIATMIIIAATFAIMQNANYIIQQQKDANSKILAYLEIGVSDDKVEDIRSELSAMEGITEFTYASKEEAIERAREISPILVDGYTEEELEILYQPYFSITFEDMEAEKEIVAKLRTLDGVGKNEDDVIVSESARDAIKKAKTAQIISATLLILIVELSILLIMNSTKLMLYAKRKEISIMKYVGATDGFIKVPFIIEGVIVAFIAVLVTMLLVSFVYNPVSSMIAKTTTYRLLSSGEILGTLTFILLAVGAGIGIIGSSSAMNKYLDV